MLSVGKNNSGIPYPKVPDDRKALVGRCAKKNTPQETALIQRHLREGLSEQVIGQFRQMVYGYYREHCRVLPWREHATSWQVLVSEVMLQQTQVERVIPKYPAFLGQFPDPASLVAAPLPELLAAWQGLGYNRRALALQRAARMLVEQYDGQVPDDPEQLRQLPGIGSYTAGAIAAFAFNQPTVFLETNIRAVLLHLFCADRQQVADKELLLIAERTLDRQQPGQWYNALMDYGSDLKRRFPNPSRRSRQHSVQSRFEGSDRQVRGAVLRLLLKETSMQETVLCEQLAVESGRLQRILAELVQEGFIVRKGGRCRIC